MTFYEEKNRDRHYFLAILLVNHIENSVCPYLSPFNSSKSLPPDKYPILENNSIPKR